MEQQMKRIGMFLQALIVLVVLAATSSLVEARPTHSNQPVALMSSPARLIPSPITIDQVIHEFGNIATTVDSWGISAGMTGRGCRRANGREAVIIIWLKSNIGWERLSE